MFLQKGSFYQPAVGLEPEEPHLQSNGESRAEGLGVFRGVGCLGGLGVSGYVRRTLMLYFAFGLVVVLPCQMYMGQPLISFVEKVYCLFLHP